MPHLNEPYHTLQLQKKACRTLWVTTILMLFYPGCNNKNILVETGLFDIVE